MILPVLVIILFPGLIIYPLSDLPAFLLLIGAIYLLTNLNLEVQSDIKNVLLLIASGFLAGAAYNTRTIYIFPFFCIFFIIPFYFIRNRTVCARLVALAAFTVGAFLVSLPQALINLRTQGALTPQVISQQTDKSLFALQLMWGITIQRYETTIDPAAPSPSRYFVDKAGEQLFSAKNVANLEVSIVNYISLLVENPLEFVGIFGRHVVNGLDLRDGEVYVNDVKSTRGGITIVNLLVLLSGLFVIVIRATNRCAVSIPSSLSDPQKNFTRTPASKSWFLFLFILLLPVIVIIPGAVETRFFLPVQLLIYATIAFNCSFSEIINFSNNKWRQICIVFFVLATLFLAISTNTMSSLQANINPSYRFGQ